jgi:NAD(P)-dependent dehydrogenase (short-subunit alcohol dehydrogenase family)
MNLKLKNKRILITGSTSGIGFATAKLFAKEEASVVINGRSQKNIDKAIKSILNEYPDADITGINADFHDKNSINNLIETINNIDILINNVGIYKSLSFEETTDSDWLDMFEVNVMSGVRLSRAFLPNMLKKNWGRILFISSECAQLVPEDLIAYSTSKAAVLSVSRGLAQLTKGTNVTVNAVLPGSTLSEGASRFLQEQADKDQITKKEVADNFFKDVRTSSLLQRFTSTEEISNTIVYLSSPLSSATNGAAIKVDGGSISGII